MQPPTHVNIMSLDITIHFLHNSGAKPSCFGIWGVAKTSNENSRNNKTVARESDTHH